MVWPQTKPSGPDTGYQGGKWYLLPAACQALPTLCPVPSPGSLCSLATQAPACDFWSFFTKAMPGSMWGSNLSVPGQRPQSPGCARAVPSTLCPSACMAWVPWPTELGGHTGSGLFLGISHLVFRETLLVLEEMRPVPVGAQEQNGHADGPAPTGEVGAGRGGPHLARYLERG